MTPDEIQKDRETGTPGELAERLIRIKDGITHRADRDALSNAVNLLYALTAENAALKARVVELEAALVFYADEGAYLSVYTTRECGCCSDSIVPVEDDAGKIARAALEKSHDRS